MGKCILAGHTGEGFSGVLPVARGGTGVSSLAALRSALSSCAPAVDLIYTTQLQSSGKAVSASKTVNIDAYSLLYFDGNVPSTSDNYNIVSAGSFTLMVQNRTFPLLVQKVAGGYLLLGTKASGSSAGGVNVTFPVVVQPTSALNLSVSFNYNWEGNTATATFNVYGVRR